jgi:glycosyltransferase involved in cell wall biosynthesis
VAGNAVFTTPDSTGRIAGEKSVKISLVVPVFNEADSIPIFYRAVREHGELKNHEVEIIFIDDGSRDATNETATALALRDPLVVLVSFTRNFGKEAALCAGLEHAGGEAVIPIDVDLQDPIDIIPRLIEKWENGAEIVLAKRQDRRNDSFLKRKTAEYFYALHNLISSPPIEENVGDFRLLSRKTVEAIQSLHERNLFMKGILSWVGGKTEIVNYTRARRVSGTTKFNGLKLWNLALEGIMNFSTIPLKIWTYIGLLISIFSFLYGSYIILGKFLYGNPVPGYPSLLVCILFIGGVQLISIGVLGEYVGRIYMETKRRPRYVIREIVRHSSGSPNAG